MAGVDRRTLLLGGAAAGTGIAVALVAEAKGWWEIPLISNPNPDSAIVRVGRRTEAQLIAWYDEALAQTGDDPARERLAEYREQHAAHLAALDGGEDDITDAAAEEGRLALPPDPAAWPGFFGEQEALAGAQDDTAVRIASEGGLARLFALIGSSELLHARGWGNG